MGQTALGSDIPEELGAISKKKEVVENAIGEGLEEQKSIDDELHENIKPFCEQYLVGLNKEADRLEAAGQIFDAKILNNEVLQVGSSPEYFVSIIKGEFPLPLGLDSNPAHTVLLSRIVGHWKAQGQKGEFAILSDGTALFAKPLQVGSWTMEEGKAFLSWKEGKMEITFPEDDLYTLSTYNNWSETTGVYRRVDRAASGEQDFIVGSWIRNNDVIYNFTTEGTYQVSKWNRKGTYQSVDGGYEAMSGENRLNLTKLENGTISGISPLKNGMKPFILKKVK